MTLSYGWKLERNSINPSGKSDLMPRNRNDVETWARQLERLETLENLKECKTMEDFQALVKKYEALCNSDNA